MDWTSPKESPIMGVVQTPNEPHEPAVTPGREAEKKGTAFDQHDMCRMGKRQETRARHFPSPPIPSPAD